MSPQPPREITNLADWGGMEFISRGSGRLIFNVGLAR